MIKSIKDTPLENLLRLTPKHAITSESTKLTKEVIELMNDAKVGSIVIVNESIEPIGIFTERDVLTKIVNGNLEKLDAKISETMTKTPKTINKEHSIHDGLKQMRFGKYRNLIIVDNDNKFVDIISGQVILEYLEDEINQLLN